MSDFRKGLIRFTKRQISCQDDNVLGVVQGGLETAQHRLIKTIA